MESAQAGSPATIGFLDHDTERFARKATLAASFGSAVEYYDFAIYGVLAVTLSSLFFPQYDPSVAILATLGIFATAFIARPLGGMFFGMLGDRYGRSRTLMATVLGMGGATVLIGLLPTYDSIGFLAPLLLLGLRTLQGFFAGGEVTGAATYIAECVPAEKRGFYGAFNPAGVALGFGLASGLTGITVAIVGTDGMLHGGWRIPFLLSGVLVAISFYLRSRMEDSPHFRKIQATHKSSASPLREAVTGNTGTMIKAFLVAYAFTASGWFSLSYVNLHLIRTLGYPAQAVFWLMAAATILAGVCMPFAGALSDRIGRKTVLVAGYASYIVIVPVCLFLMGGANFPLTVAVTLVSLVPFVLVQATGYPFFAELFPTRVRYSAVSLSFNLAAIVGGGFTPYIGTWLVQSTGHAMAPAYYVMGAALVGLLTMLGTVETARRPLLD
jgi:MHS family proline/betaine transporter-like MFS transporter